MSATDVVLTLSCERLTESYEKGVTISSSVVKRRKGAKQKGVRFIFLSKKGSGSFFRCFGWLRWPAARADADGSLG